MATKPANTLARLTGKGADLAKAMENKHFKRLVERESRTTRLALQERRLRLEAKNQFIGNSIARLMSGKVTNADEREKLMNMANLLAMQGITEGLGLVVDCLTRVYTKTKTDKDGNVVTGKKRVSVAENVEDIHDMMIDLLQVGDVNLNIVNDIGLRLNTWKDQHGVNRSPYLRDEDEKAEKAESDAADNLQREADEDIVTDAEEQRILKDVDQRVAQDEVDGVEAEQARSGNEEE